MLRDQPGIRNNQKSGAPQSKRLPFILAAAAGIAAFLVTSVMPKQYRSDTTLYFPGSGDSGAASLIGVLGGGAVGMADKGNVPLLGGIVSSPLVANGPNTAMTVLASDRLRTQVAQSLGLEARWHESMKDVRSQLDSNVTFSVNKYGLLQIEATDKDPDLSTQIVDAYTKTLQSVATELSIKVSHRNRVFLEGRLHKIRMQLAVQENRLVRLSKHSADSLPPKEAGEKMGVAYTEVAKELNMVDTQLAAIKAKIDWELAASHRLALHSLDLTAKTPLASESIAHLRKLEADFAIANETLGPDNPDYKLLKLQLEAARAQVRLEVGREVSAIQSGLAPEVAALYVERAGLSARRSGLEQARRQLQATLTKMPVAAMSEQHLLAEIKINETLVGMLETEVERARIAEARDTPTFEIVDAPERPSMPFAPRKVFVSLFATLAGLLVGFAINISKSVRQSAEISQSATFQTEPRERVEVG